MSLTAAFQEIESHELAAKLNIASDLRTFIRAATRQEPVRRLIRQLDAPGVAEQLIRRVVRLARRRIDPRFANPWDVPLAVYIWVLDLKDSPLRILGAGAGIETLATWWARKVAEKVLAETATRSDAVTGVYQPVFEPVRTSVSTEEEYDTFFIADYSIPFISAETEVQFAIAREVENAADDGIIILPDVSDFLTSTTSGTELVQRLVA